MANIEIRINGIKLFPQPASTQWTFNGLGNTVGGPVALGKCRSFIITPPQVAEIDQFNWKQFENTTLTSLQAYAPGDGPDGMPVVYSGLIVSRPLNQTIGLDRSMSGFTWELLVEV